MFVPMREELALHRLKPRKKKKAHKVFVDIEVPKGIPVHIPAPRHIDVIKHVDPKPLRRRDSLHLPLTAGFHLPWDAEPHHRHRDVVKEHGHHHRRHHHHDVPKEPRHHHHPRNPFVPDPPRCALHCGNARMKGSPFCPGDTCRDTSCNRQSSVWGGYCDRHGCGVQECLRRRQVSKVAGPGKHGAENFVVSRFCGVHSCRSWGCSGVGRSRLDGFCEEHYVQCRRG